jgi:hypothetical protein
LYILIFNLDDVLFIFVDNTEKFALDLDEMVRGIGLAEVEHFFLEDEIWIVSGLPVRMSMSSTFFFFMVEFQWFLMELSVRPGSILVISAHLLPWAVWARKSTHS